MVQEFLIKTDKVWVCFALKFWYDKSLVPFCSEVLVQKQKQTGTKQNMNWISNHVKLDEICHVNKAVKNTFQNISSIWNGNIWNGTVFIYGMKLFVFENKSSSNFGAQKH